MEKSRPSLIDLISKIRSNAKVEAQGDKMADDDDDFREYEDDDVFQLSPEQKAERAQMVLDVRMVQLRPGDEIPQYAACAYWSGRRYEAFKNETQARNHVTKVWMRGIEAIPKDQRNLGWWMDSYGAIKDLAPSRGDCIALYPVIMPLENEIGEMAP